MRKRSSAAALAAALKIRVVTSRDAAGAPCRNGFQRLKAPHIVDHQEAPLVVQLLRDLEHRVVLVLEAGPLARQRRVQITLELVDDRRLFAERHPGMPPSHAAKHVGVVAHA